MKKIDKLPQAFFPGIFVPVLAMFVLLMTSTTFLKNAGTYLDVMSDAKDIPILKMVSASVIFLLAVGFAFLINKVSLRKWLPRLLMIMIALLGALALFANSLHASGLKFYFYYCATHLICPTLMSVLLWGYVNQITHLWEGLFYYIPLAIIGGACSSLLHMWSYRLLFDTSLSLATIYIYGLSFLLVAVALCFWMNHLIPHNRWSSEDDSEAEKNPGKPILAFGYALGAFTFIGLLLKVNFVESIYQIHKNPTDYAMYMAHHSIMIGTATIVTSLIVLFAGPLLLKYKGWRFTALIAPVIAAALLIALCCGLPLQYTKLIFGSLNQALLFPVLQIAYLSLRKENRLQTKAWAELIVVPIFAALASLLNQASVVSLGTTLKLFPYGIVLDLLAAAGLIAVVYKIGSRRGLSKASL